MYRFRKCLGGLSVTLLLWGFIPALLPLAAVGFFPAWGQTQGDLKVEEFRLYREGVALFKQNRYQEALDTLNQSLAIAQQLEDWDRQGRTLHYIGSIYFTLEDYPTALENYQEALTAYRAIGDNDENGQLSLDSVYKDNEIGILGNIGMVYYNLGQYDRALEYHQNVLETAQTLGNLGREREARNNIGLIYSHLGEYSLALEFLEKALELRSQVVDNSGAGSTQYNIGLVYFKLGDYDQALDFFQQALAIVRKLENRAGEIRTLNVIGNVYSRTERDNQAISTYQTALKLAENSEISSLQGGTLHNLGKVYQNQENYTQALDYYQQALDLYQATNRQFGIGVILNNMGEAYFHSGQTDTAFNYYQQALAINKTLKNPAGEAENFSNIAAILAQQNQLELAIVFYKQAVNATETIRQNNRQLSSELQQTYTETVADYYRHLADLLLQQNRILEAQQVLDLLKVQELQDYLQNVRSSNTTQNSIPNISSEQQIWANYEDLTDQAIEIGQELSQLRQIPLENRTPTQQQRLMQLVSAQTELTRNFNNFIASPEVTAWVEQLSPTVRNPSFANNLDNLIGLRDNLGNLDQNTALIYPLILKDRLELILVTADAPPLRRTVAVTETELNETILAFRQVLQNPTLDATPTAQKLYRWLIQPLEADLKVAGTETLIYAPDGQLRYVPLAALHDGENWLIERFGINNITAASLTDLNTQPQTQFNILAGAYASVSYPIQVGSAAFDFAPLPYTQKEVEMLAETIPATTALIDTAFSLDAVIPQMNDYNILHFATHGAFVVGSPQDSFILFGDGEIATLADIKNWSLQNVDLVVLSACETGLGGVLGNGEEILGLGYQFQRAGARTTIASLWAVDDGGTQVLMNAFYDRLQQPQMSKVEALRQAQLALIQSDSTSAGGDRGLVAVRWSENLQPRVLDSLSHPYYWASFIVIGNGL